MKEPISREEYLKLLNRIKALQYVMSELVQGYDLIRAESLSAELAATVKELDGVRIYCDEEY